MATGTVKFFNYNRGYGFISDDAGGTERCFRIRSVIGDRVHVEMTPYDLSKGRIIFRERMPGQGPGPRRGVRR